MRKLLRMKENEGQEKVSEKNLLTRGLVALTVVILCLAAMTLTAFAYYSLDIVSGSNKIKAAFFDVDVVIDNGNITVIPGANKTYSASLPAGTHSIKVAHSAQSTANTGFVTIAVADGMFYTRQLTKSDNTDSLTFTFETNAKMDVEFSACWGTYIYHNTQADIYITENKNITVAGISDEEVQEPDVSETTEPEETESEATEPAPTEPEVTEPTPTESEVTQPEATEPTPTEPEATQPESTESTPTEPEVTQPEATDPTPTEPEATQPEATEGADEAGGEGTVISE